VLSVLAFAASHLSTSDADSSRTFLAPSDRFSQLYGQAWRRSRCPYWQLHHRDDELRCHL
jgi:hypothetical protein